jgi:UDP-glucose 4-epimerase
VRRYFVAGGLGFIGSHLVRRLLGDTDAEVVVYDNASSGRLWHLPYPGETERLTVILGDLKDRGRLTDAMPVEVDTVVQLASNPDIARAADEPDLDFWEGTYLTQNLLEAMRVRGARRLVYASGSGVYGETGERRVSETHTPLRPISTYGASKLACEALIGAYCHLFGFHGLALRFANVVGPGQTHGVALDFIRRLLDDPTRLRVLGDGFQSKCYVHVDDVMDAILLLERQGWSGFEVFNVATDDAMTVREIAAECARRTGAEGVVLDCTGGDRGWKGDVPVVRFETAKLRARGWRPRRTSAEAVRDAVDALVEEVRAGRFQAQPEGVSS